jgi:cytochrome b6-f complex iron-sulfur subunit
MSDCCRDCLSRREFIARSAGGAALTVLASCIEAPTVPTSPHLEIIVSSFPGLAATGQLVKVGPSHAAKRTGTDTFVAFSMFCTHAGCQTSLNGQQFTCPCHGSRFDSSGAVTQGPADKPLPSLATSYNAATDTLTIN